MKLFRILGGVIATLLFATGVGQTAAAGDHEIVLGFAVSMSGWFTDYSGPPALGAKLAISDINNSGGLLGKQIRVVEADVRSERTEGAKAGLAVISKGVDMVVVDCDFDMGGPAALRAQSAGLIAFSLCAGDAKMGPIGIGPLAFNASPWTCLLPTTTHHRVSTGRRNRDEDDPAGPHANPFVQLEMRDEVASHRADDHLLDRRWREDVYGKRELRLSARRHRPGRHPVRIHR